MSCGTRFLEPSVFLAFAAIPSAKCGLEFYHVLSFMLKFHMLISLLITDHPSKKMQFFKYMRSMHTAGRDVFNSFLGNRGFSFVQIGNILCSRLVLMLLICSARGCRWLVEQPEGSSLPNHPRFQELLEIVRVPWHLQNLDWCILHHIGFSCLSIADCPFRFAPVVTTVESICFDQSLTSLLAKVYTGSFWMGCFNGNTAKRHRLWSNDRWLLQQIVNRGAS